MQQFYGLDRESVSKVLESQGEKPYRADQVFDWVYRKGVTSFDEMYNIPLELRAILSKRFSLNGLKNVSVNDSEDGETQKFLWKVGDFFVESVLILSKERRTVCVSSQVGCNARCSFCASGKKGWKKDLSSSEIVEQVVKIDSDLKKKGERVTHVVFMGMGEPLDNYDAVKGATLALIDPKRMGLSSRRVTVSTVGVIPGIEKLMMEGLKISLVLSLHAPSQKLRERIIPYAKKYPLDEVLDKMDQYQKKTGRDVTYEYILIKGVNDSLSHAEELANLLEGKRGSVNLIPYNPVIGIKWERPSKEAVGAFRKVLMKRGVVATQRYTKGVDIAAACGQLALIEGEKGLVNF